MRKPFLLAAVLIASAAAFADITFYNQPWNGDNFLCDANTPSCTDNVNVTGWTVYDNFGVPNGVTRITDFTFVDQSFAWNVYTGTNWTVFGPNVSNPFGVVPRYSGTAVATMTDLGDGYMMLSITGLNLAVTPGTWIVGFQNNMGGLDSDLFSTRGTSNVGDGVVWQQANGGIKQFTWSDNTAFSVSTSLAPEPSTFLMIGTGLLGGIGAIRRNLR
jgi:hypothetical protein